ncbi:hypothetical protein D6C86_01166 [Aureobasidium pullulans]|uniref:Uncharacterized protein n=1 Tax=Aureobasidium pullulans TaxID=5580 RepID=A0A4S9WME8_AURPU|nr:hypothetical protein D6D27_07290 [Aureobasidium pullulans]THX03555.1 hypothetical protein D6D18_03750 [Aureobasidium pullulans]THY50724.1 hypothetical protein D6C97_06925 [Aureobasidium pullulans]THY77289.1 hypothetical protein D6C94_02234 [Aureobasidium pullulans]THZ48076.1 hypothetical protein D6C87_00900 [Aureobasidium pullulans]
MRTQTRSIAPGVHVIAWADHEEEHLASLAAMKTTSDLQESSHPPYESPFNRSFGYHFESDLQTRLVVRRGNYPEQLFGDVRKHVLSKTHDVSLSNMSDDERQNMLSLQQILLETGKYSHAYIRVTLKRKKDWKELHELLVKAVKQIMGKHAVAIRYHTTFGNEGK